MRTILNMKTIAVNDLPKEVQQEALNVINYEIKRYTTDYNPQEHGVTLYDINKTHKAIIIDKNYIEAFNNGYAEVYKSVLSFIKLECYEEIIIKHNKVYYVLSMEL